MIFVTVGTHEQPFNRLISKVDELVHQKIIDDEVFMQIGYSTYEPKYTKWEKLIGYDLMAKYEDYSDIIITHGGPATYMSALSKNKKVIVVPRQKKFGEHINDHQLDFALRVQNKGYSLKVIYNIEDLADILRSDFVNSGFKSNNDLFCSKLEDLIMS